MDQYRTQGQPESVKADITDIAMEYHLVSKFTSLVAVDKTPVRPEGKALKTHAMATNRPVGWKMGTLPQTATPAMLQILIGLLSLLSGLMLRRKQQ